MICEQKKKLNISTAGHSTNLFEKTATSFTFTASICKMSLRNVKLSFSFFSGIWGALESFLKNWPVKLDKTQNYFLARNFAIKPMTHLSCCKKCKILDNTQKWLESGSLWYHHAYFVNKLFRVSSCLFLESSVAKGHIVTSKICFNLQARVVSNHLRSKIDLEKTLENERTLLGKKCHRKIGISVV